MILYAKDLTQKAKNNLKEMGLRLSRPPRLTIFSIGSDEASRSYVRGKEKDFEECGFYCETIHMPSFVSQDELLLRVAEESCNHNVDGILVQLPLPSHISAEDIFEHIPPWKDVDGLTKTSMFHPCTPQGIISLLDGYGIGIKGKHCVIVGRSKIVGRPLAGMMLDRNATVTVCHSYTNNLPLICREADILVSAVGKPKFITADMVKDGAVVIDVGINRDENGKMCGDVDFENVSNVASAITPVPGGIGLMTRVSLLSNTYIAALHNDEQRKEDNCLGLSR